MKDALQQLKHKYIRSFGQKYENIETAWREKDFSQLEYLLHKLAGSSGSYGYPQLNQLCTQAETILKGESTSNHTDLAKIIQLILVQLKTRTQ